MDKGLKVKTENTESRAVTVWKTIGIIALSIFLAVLTVLVINI